MQCSVSDCHSKLHPYIARNEVTNEMELPNIYFVPAERLIRVAVFQSKNRPTNAPFDFPKAEDLIVKAYTLFLSLPRLCVVLEIFTALQALICSANSFKVQSREELNTPFYTAHPERGCKKLTDGQVNYKLDQTCMALGSNLKDVTLARLRKSASHYPKNQSEAICYAAAQNHSLAASTKPHPLFCK
jgi:hypothetical protein